MILNDFQKMILMTLKTPCREKHLFKTRLANQSEGGSDELHFGFVVGLGVGALVGIADEESRRCSPRHTVSTTSCSPRAGKKTLSEIFTKTAYANEYLRSESS